MSYENIRLDIQAIINTHGQTGTITRQTESTDSMGGVSSISEEEWTVKFIMQDITKKDRQIHEMGLAIPGNVKAFFYNEYPDSITGNGTLQVQAGDTLYDEKGKTWRIEQMIGKRKSLSKEIFKIAIMKKIDLNK